MDQETVYEVGVLGATGIVGQRIVLLVEQNRLFNIKALGGSERSSGKKYCSAVEKSWKHDVSIPKDVANLEVKPCEPQFFEGCDVIFSSLDSSVATEIERKFIQHGFFVFTNSSNFRMKPTIPICVPTANPEHLNLVKVQLESGSKGCIVTNANCATTGIVVTLRALINKFGPITHMCVVTMQAISGAGYPGVPAMDIMSNVIPYIKEEEQKIERETLKILSVYDYTKNEFEAPEMAISASCNRVPVLNGHMMCVSVKFRNRPIPSTEEIIETFTNYNPLAKYGSILTKYPAIVVDPDEFRPQPALDSEINCGYSVIVGRIRECPVLDIKYTLLCNNVVLGAAGSCILNAEIARDMGILKKIITAP